MLRRLRFAKRLVTQLPQQLRLAYCLYRDVRVSIIPKALLVGALGIIVTPFIDLPAVLPVVGEIDMLALSILSLKLFIQACPSEVVAEQEQLIVEQRSRFDQDVLAGERVALAIWNRLHPETEDVASKAPHQDVGEWDSAETEHGVVA